MPERATHRKSDRFDYLFSNTFGIAGSENSITIVFSLEEPNFENEEKKILDQTAVMLTPKALKTLWYSIGQVVEKIEKDHGEINIGEPSQLESSSA